jgi:dethiobiotin synthetase
MKPGYFITGTDTGIGKTIVSTLLIQHFIAQGENVIGMKPLASGAKLVDGQLQNEDALALLEASNIKASYELINPYCFAPAIAPHIAAAKSQTTISLSHILDCYSQLSKRADRMIIEGVGGWRVPIDEQQDVADLAKAFNLPVILVVGMRLGCLNHAVLSAEAILAKGCNLVGWVANCVDANMPAYDENLASLMQRISRPLLAVIPNLKIDQSIPTAQVTWYFTNPKNRHR